MLGGFPFCTSVSTSVRTAPSAPGLMGLGDDRRQAPRWCDIHREARRRLVIVGVVYKEYVVACLRVRQALDRNGRLRSGARIQFDVDIHRRSARRGMDDAESNVRRRRRGSVVRNRQQDNVAPVCSALQNPVATKL